MNLHRAAHGRGRSLRRNQTDAERKLWALLRGRQMHGTKFRRQHAVGQYIVDFRCPEQALVIELDGGHHALQADKDQERTDLLEERGYRMLRFWNNEVQTQPDAVLERIVAVLGLPHPNPLPGQGEGARRESAGA